jgi:uncharacterized small protein (TIGR04563 family)
MSGTTSADEGEETVMARSEKQKQSLYFPDETLREIMREANRLDRSLSWTVQQAWRIARDGVRRFPSPDRRESAPAEPRPTPAGAIAPRPAERVVAPSRQVAEFLKGKFDRDAGT